MKKCLFIIDLGKMAIFHVSLPEGSNGDEWGQMGTIFATIPLHTILRS